MMKTNKVGGVNMRRTGIIAVNLALCLVTAMLLTVAANSAEPIEQQARLTPTELTCEYAVNPLGVDAARPRFGWVLQSNEHKVAARFRARRTSFCKTPRKR